MVPMILAASAGACLTSLLSRWLSNPGEPSGNDSGAVVAGLRIEALAWQRPPISDRLRYGLTGLTGLLVFAAFLRFDGAVATGVSLLIVALMVCTTTDLLTYRVPDVITLPSGLAALALSLAYGDVAVWQTLAAPVLAGIVFGGVAWLTRGGLGMGDVKLAVMIGTALGLPSAAFALATGILTGGLFVIALYVTRRISSDQAVPFGPFLALSAVAWLLILGPAFA